MAKFMKGGPSPNPSGRPKGSKSAPNLLRDGLVSVEELKEVVEMIVQKAKDGDMQAAAALLDRTVPKLRPAADPEEEGAVAAARAQGALSAGPAGISLEQLVSGSFMAVMSRPTELPATSQHAAAAPPSSPTSAPLSQPEPPRSIRITMPPVPDGDPGEPYNPL